MDETGLAANFVLSIVGLITGLLARFGSGKDNFGVAGIGLAIVAPILGLPG